MGKNDCHLKPVYVASDGAAPRVLKIIANLTNLQGKAMEIYRLMGGLFIDIWL